MQYSGLDQFLKQGKDALTKGVIGIVCIEDGIEVDTCLRHHLNLGFSTLVVLAQSGLSLPKDVPDKVHVVEIDIHAPRAFLNAINRIIPAAAGQWLYFCFNAEFLFFPFCETRTIGEMLAFHTEERRSAMLSYVIDLYADDLAAHPNAVSLENALLDKSGYYALARPDANNHNHPKERQLDFFGGLRWRFEEHVPKERRKIDRISLFIAREELRMRDDFTFSDEEYNTYACPWHHNLTAAICSFRTAKALKLNPGSTFDIDRFEWHNSTKFEWTSQQLLDLGLMEPGQWF